MVFEGTTECMNVFIVSIPNDALEQLITRVGEALVGEALREALQEALREALQEALLNGLYSSIVHFLKRPTKMAGYEGEFINFSVVPVASRK